MAGLQYSGRVSPLSSAILQLITKEQGLKEIIAMRYIVLLSSLACCHFEGCVTLGFVCAVVHGWGNGHTDMAV